MTALPDRAADAPGGTATEILFGQTRRSNWPTGKDLSRENISFLRRRAGQSGFEAVAGKGRRYGIVTVGPRLRPDIERAAARVPGVRPGCAVAVRLDAGHSRETFAVAVESAAWQDPAEVRRIERQVAHEVVAEADVRPRNVVVLQPGMIPKTPSGKLRRAHALALVN